MTTTLTRLEIEEQAAYDRYIDIEYVPPSDPRLRGRGAGCTWSAGSPLILINRRLLNSEKLELLLHERGHIETHNGFGASEERAELLAWEWAYRYYIDRDKLAILCETHRLDGEPDYAYIADLYDITPRFIIGACQYFHFSAPYRDADLGEDALRIVR